MLLKHFYKKIFTIAFLNILISTSAFSQNDIVIRYVKANTSGFEIKGLFNEALCESENRLIACKAIGPQTFLIQEGQIRGQEYIYTLAPENPVPTGAYQAQCSYHCFSFSELDYVLLGTSPEHPATVRGQ